MAPDPIPLAQYAAVAAALEEGFLLEEALEVEQLNETIWTEAELIFRGRIASDESALNRYTEALATAQDRLGRRAAPLDSDLVAWVSFLDRMAKEPAPFRYMEKLGLRAPDLARLQRQWKSKLEQDELAKRAEAIRKEEAFIAIGPLELGTSELRASADAGTFKPKPPEEPAAASRAPATQMPGSFSLHRYATMQAEIELSPQQQNQIFERYGLGAVAAREQLLNRFATLLGSDEMAKRDYRALHAHALRQLLQQRARRAPSSARTSPAARMGPGATGPSRPAETAPVAQPVDPTVHSPQNAMPPVHKAPAHLSGTAPTARKRGKTLPFAAPIPGARMARATPEPVPIVAARPSHDPTSSRPTSSPLVATMPHTSRTSNPTLPFAAGPKGAPHAGHGSSPTQPPTTQPETTPSLTLFQMAALQVELDLSPEDRAAVLTRHNLSERQKQRLDARWGPAMTQNAALLDAYQRAYQSYREWFLAKRP